MDSIGNHNCQWMANQCNPIETLYIYIHTHWNPKSISTHSILSSLIVPLEMKCIECNNVARSGASHVYRMAIRGDGINISINISRERLPRHRHRQNAPTHSLSPSAVVVIVVVVTIHSSERLRMNTYRIEPNGATDRPTDRSAVSFNAST